MWGVKSVIFLVGLSLISDSSHQMEISAFSRGKHFPSGDCYADQQFSSMIAEITDLTNISQVRVL